MSILRKLFLFSLLLATSASGATFEERGWLAFGDMRGHIEPCGCDPTADLGGVKRLGTLLARERRSFENLSLLNLGNNLPSNRDAEAVKIPFILETLHALKPVASLLNWTEFENFPDIKQADLAKQYLLSNVRDKKTSAYADTLNSYSADGVQIFGYFYDKKFAKQLRSVDKKLISEWRGIAGKDSKSDYRVLLFSGSDKDLAEISKSKIFNLILSSNRQPLATIVGPEEKANPGLLMRRINGNGFAMVPLGSQGVLRGGELLKQEAKSLKEILDNKTCKPSDIGAFDRKCTPDSDGIGLGSKFVTWLDADYNIGSPFDAVMERYYQASTNKFKIQAEARIKDLKDSKFAGSETCKTCHASAYSVWEKTGHAHAYKTLQDKSKDQDPECVSCHTLGYKAKGGFVSIKDSPQFANVNCENCHGPRKDHATNPKIKPKWPSAKNVCVECHQGMHSPQFKFETYWPKILHK